MLNNDECLCVSEHSNVLLLCIRAHQLAERFFNQKNGDSQHVVYAMGHAHMDSGKITCQG